VRFLNIPLFLISLSSCTSYRPLPFSNASIQQRLRTPAAKALQIAAAQLHHPLLAPVRLKALHGPKLVGIRLWIPQNARKTDLDLKSSLLPAPDGHLFPLGRVASFDTVSGQPQIK
jgi:hypothetical protein